jgi:hypothetical protein
MKLISTDRLTREQILDIVNDSNNLYKDDIIECVDYICSKPNRYIIASSFYIGDERCSWEWMDKDNVYCFRAEVENLLFIIGNSKKRTK